MAEKCYLLLLGMRRQKGSCLRQHAMEIDGVAQAPLLACAVERSKDSLSSALVSCSSMQFSPPEQPAEIASE